MPPNPKGCCGVVSPCCGVPIPDELHAHISNVSHCACVDGEVVTLKWDPLGPAWKGTAGGSACFAHGNTWVLMCGGNDCSKFTLSITGSVCIAINSSLDPNCSCQDANTGGINLLFTVQMGGLSCCEPAVD